MGPEWSCGSLWPPAGGPFFLTAAASSSQDLTLGKGQPYRAGVTLCFLQRLGTLISRIPMRVWVEQG